jgi:hypothetical protein
LAHPSPAPKTYDEDGDEGPKTVQK